MSRTSDSVLKDIREHPERHRHDFEGLMLCCKTSDGFDLEIMDAHSKYVKLGTNGGVRCDVIDGPCACGAWH